MQDYVVPLTFFCENINIYIMFPSFLPYFSKAVFCISSYGLFIDITEVTLRQNTKIHLGCILQQLKYLPYLCFFFSPISTNANTACVFCVIQVKFKCTLFFCRLMFAITYLVGLLLCHRMYYASSRENTLVMAIHSLCLTQTVSFKIFCIFFLYNRLSLSLLLCVSSWDVLRVCQEKGTLDDHPFFVLDL